MINIFIETNEVLEQLRKDGYDIEVFGVNATFKDDDNPWYINAIGPKGTFTGSGALLSEAINDVWSKIVACSDDEERASVNIEDALGTLACNFGKVSIDVRAIDTEHETWSASVQGRNAYGGTLEKAAAELAMMMGISL